MQIGCMFVHNISLIITQFLSQNIRESLIKRYKFLKNSQPKLKIVQNYVLILLLQMATDERVELGQVSLKQGKNLLSFKFNPV